jgi:UDP-GlcNAc:undecaprenyl-phosphate GlcNAc-1-phosphate transferase
LWVIGMANAVNLIDGLDGLAAGIVAIGSATFFAYAYDLIGNGTGYLDPSSSGPLIAIVVCGLCVGFLPWNVHPARIFMGDGGALLLGVLMASSTVVVGGQSGDTVARGQTYFFFAPLFIPLVILGVPVVDTVWAIIRRATRRSGLATADKDHLHHRLMRLGHGHWRSVAILWGWTAALSILVLYPVYNDSGNGVVPFLVVASFLVLYTVLHPEVRRRAADAPPAIDEPLPDRSAPSESDVSDVLPARGPDA